MQIDVLQYLNGLTNGVYLTIACTLMLFAFSYLNKHHYNRRIVFALIALSFAFFGFGMFHVFLQQNHIPSFFPVWFIVACAVVTPLSMAILLFLYLRALSIRSYEAFVITSNFRWLEYILYAVFIGVACYVPFVGSIYKAAELLILSFIPATLALAILSFLMGRNFLSGYVFGVIFAFVAFSCIYVVVTHEALLPQSIRFVMFFFFALLSIVFCFFIVRYGYEEIKSFFLVRSLDQFHILNDINKAIKHKQFHLAYQPQVDIQKDAIVGVEALIRWEHPKKGEILPDHFIPLAEESGMINNITYWVIIHAIQDARNFANQGYPLKVSLNFSSRNFNTRIVEHLISEIRKHKLPAHFINIEITESVMMQENSTEVKNALQILENAGIRLSVDDYGTGFSSLSYLQKMSVSELKIDQTFIKNLNASLDTYAIVFSTLQMSRNLGMVSVAEGVEDQKTLETLKNIGCDVVQGFAIAKPMRAEQLIEFMKQVQTQGLQKTIR